MGKDLFLLALFVVSTVLLFGFSSGSPSAVSVKNIEANLSRINSGLYVYRYETSRAEYQVFLEYLLKHNQTDLYRKYQVSREPNEEEAREDYPVTNISHEAALAYCSWLTDQYNRDPMRKFRKVTFRLPTETEWNALANGGVTEKLYPWESPYLRDREGRLLCNFRPVGDQQISRNPGTGTYHIVNDPAAAPGEAHITPVKSFEPMGPYGLYNLCGNAAEMLEEKGIAKGGSYESGGYDVRIQSRMLYTGPSPEIGFRLLMEIQEAYVDSDH